MPGNDDSRSTATTPPTTQGKRKLEADGGTCSNPRHEPRNVSPKPKRDGAICDLILTKAGRREPRERRTQSGND